MVDAGASRFRRGFTLTEIAIVLGIVGIILGAIWSAVSMANEKNKINQAVEELQETAQGVLSIYAGRSFSSAGDKTPTMIAAGAIPSWAVVSATQAENPWDAAAETASGGRTAPGGLVVWVWGVPNLSAFTVSFYEVPVDACIAMLTQGTSCQYGQSGCPIAICVKACDAGQWTPPNPTTTGWQALDSIQAATLCNTNASPGTGDNSVEFEYSL